MDSYLPLLIGGGGAAGAIFFSLCRTLLVKVPQIPGADCVGNWRAPSWRRGEGREKSSVAQAALSMMPLGSVVLH